MSWGEIGWTLAIMLVAFSIGSCYGYIHVLRQLGSKSTKPPTPEEEELSQEQIAEFSRAAYTTYYKTPPKAVTPIELYLVMAANRGRFTCLPYYWNRLPEWIQYELIKFDCTFSPFYTNSDIRDCAATTASCLVIKLQNLDSCFSGFNQMQDNDLVTVEQSAYTSMWQIIRKVEGKL